jgi:hypothetical protein
MPLGLSIKQFKTCSFFPPNVPAPKPIIVHSILCLLICLTNYFCKHLKFYIRYTCYPRAHSQIIAIYAQIIIFYVISNNPRAI